MDKSEVVSIGKKDVMWNYISTFFQIGAGIILLPFILRMLSEETVGIWTIFTAITTFIALLDFGFNPSFTRNITYIFSGVKELKSKGISDVTSDKSVDYSLLKGTISAMKWFYSIIAVVLLVILLSGGTLYILSVLEDYSGDRTDAIIAWIILCVLNVYNLYTQYYDCLLTGKGMIKVSKQIRFVGQIIYLLVAVILILFGQGLVAIVSAQAISIIIKRILSYKIFFTKEMKEKIQATESYDKRGIIKAIYPNAIKLGISSLGGLLITQSSTFIGSEYINLAELGSFGITNQLIAIISSLAAVYYSSFVPKISQYRVLGDFKALREKYVASILILLSVFVVGGAAMIFAGPPALRIIKSETQMLCSTMILVSLFFAFLERSNGLAAAFLLARNDVPFYKASLISGIVTVAVLYLFVGVVHWGLWGMILAPGLVQLAYQNWKWPLVVCKELNFSFLKR